MESSDLNTIESTVISASVEFGVNGADVSIAGKIHDNVPSGFIRYLAANPPEYRVTFSGSGLPFANRSQAFENTANHGACKLDDQGNFVINIAFPNSYYLNLGSVLVPPTVYIYYIDSSETERMVPIKISEGVPYRTLTYPQERRNVEFYEGGWELPVRTQEQILRDSGYPCMNKHDAEFWGLKPRQ